MEERVGGAVEDGQELTVLGRMLEPGDTAPDFALDHFTGSSMDTVSLADMAGSVVVLNVVNSVDTPVCDVQTRRVDGLFPAAKVLTVSMDLPFALVRWTNAAGVTHPAVSSHRSEAFGRDYGVLIKEWRALQRSVFVIDRDGRIAYAEYVPDQMNEPDYDAAVDAARKATSTAR
ncbi:MAG: thiol peroxidase [Actinomycetota bacterium]|nr:thiol peroxidase [Actinomycetota bacterium]